MFVAYREWVTLVILSALHLVLRIFLLHRHDITEIYCFIVSHDKCTTTTLDKSPQTHVSPSGRVSGVLCDCEPPLPGRRGDGLTLGDGSGFGVVRGPGVLRGGGVGGFGGGQVGGLGWGGVDQEGVAGPTGLVLLLIGQCQQGGEGPEGGEEGQPCVGRAPLERDHTGHCTGNDQVTCWSLYW